MASVTHETIGSRHSIDGILSQVRISAVYQVQTGEEPRRTGKDTYRARATWRAGDGFNVSMDDDRGIWHDFVTDEGGGILDLVVRVRGGSRADALHWVADFAGMPLDDAPLSTEDRRRWAEERAALEQDLPAARYWRRTAIALSEELLTTLKAALFDPTQPMPDPSNIQHTTSMLDSLQRMGDVALVAEFRWWKERYPETVALMVRTARARERAECRVLATYLRCTA